MVEMAQELSDMRLVQGQGKPKGVLVLKVRIQERESLKCPVCGSMMTKTMGREGIEFFQCDQYESHKEPV